LCFPAAGGAAGAAGAIGSGSSSVITTPQRLVKARGGPELRELSVPSELRSDDQEMVSIEGYDLVVGGERGPISGEEATLSSMASRAAWASRVSSRPPILGSPRESSSAARAGGKARMDEG
jgi:hypothetical protein